MTGNRKIDINCDMGEGMPYDKEIMPYISSANIACGYHAGDENTMRQTIISALENKVAIGAHISFPDKDGFGRTEMQLAADKLHKIILEQLIEINNMAESFGAVLHHVKPHGALYNMSARDASLAKTISRAVSTFNPALILFGLSGSHSVDEVAKAGLKTASEAFADRRYNDDGSLVSRTISGSLVEDEIQLVQQVLQMVKYKSVTSISGKTIPLLAETICIHGDGKQAGKFARAISSAIKKENIREAAI